jgi:hypothetical protein
VSARLVLVALLLGLAVGCGPSAPAAYPRERALVLPGSDGRLYDLNAAISRNALTVFVFFSEACPCMTAHEPRLFALEKELASRGVGIVMVSSEVSASPERDARVARERRYPFVLVTDRNAVLATELGARFATHAIVVDRAFMIRYSGGIDSDKKHLHDDARPYLRDALLALLEGRKPAAPGTEPLGCALMLR